MDSLTEKLKAYAVQEGADLVGVAPTRRWENAPVELSPQGLLPEARSVFVAGIHHPDASIELSKEPSIHENYIDGADGFISHKLNHIAFRTAKLLEDNNYASIIVSATWSWRYRPYKNIDNCFTPDISHIHSAVAAGFGEIGWSGLLLTPEYGPRQRVISIITDADLLPSPMYNGPSLCDRCMLCAKNCPPEALTKEVKGESVVRIEDKVYRYANKNKWRCAWAETFQFNFKIPIPEKIDEKVILDLTEKYGKQWGGTQGIGCKKYCLPPHLRYQDPGYCKGPRRKRKSTPAQVSENVPDRQITDKVKAIAFNKGIDLVGIASGEDFRSISAKPNDYMPDASSVIVFGIGYPETCSQDSGRPLPVLELAIGLRLGFVALDIAQYLENLGYSVVSGTKLDPNLAALAAGLGRLENVKEAVRSERFERDESGLTPDVERVDGLTKGKVLVTPEYEKRQILVVIITSASLVSTKTAIKTSDFESSIQAERVKVSREELNENLKLFARSKGADLIGISSAERLQPITEQLKQMIKGKKPLPVFTDKSGGRDRPFIPELHYEERKVKTPRDYLLNAKSVIVFGIHYPDAVMDRAGKPPSEAVGPYIFAQIQTLSELGFLALDVIKFLNERGYQAVPTQDLCGLAGKVATTGCGYHPDATANRYAAIAAGIGELGWHGAVLTPEYGVRQRFISIITDADLNPDPLYQGPSLCRQCFKCVTNCPVSALSKDEKVELRIENKVFEYGKCAPLQCDWAKRYALVGEGGPRYMGSSTDVMPPENVTPENLCEALKETDPLQKVWIGIVEKCLATCPSAKEKRCR